MPVEIFDVDEFIKIAERAKYCNIKRLEREVKLKLRTPRKLFTLKVNPTKAEEIIKKLSCEIREIQAHFEEIRNFFGHKIRDKKVTAARNLVCNVLIRRIIEI